MKIVHFRPVFALVLAGGCVFSAQAQSPYVGEALNYSRLQFGGPARTLGIAGANVALGADFGNITSNPAGLGLFQKSEFNLSLGLGLGAADARGNGNLVTANKGSFHVASAGAVFTQRRPDDLEAGWNGGSFALGFTRLADFNRSFRYNNRTSDNASFLQYLSEPGGTSDAGSAAYQNVVTDVLGQDKAGKYTSIEGLAYGNFLTDTILVRVPGGKRTKLEAAVRDGVIDQHETVTTQGSMSQFDLAYGGNYRNRLFLGGGLGIVSVNRQRISIFSEDFGGAQDFEVRDDVRTTGTGLNARLGIIYRPCDWVRLGTSVQTPTYIRLSDTYNTTLTVNPDLLPPGSTLSNVLSTVPGAYSYSIVTPFRTSAGVAFLLSKYGFLSGDVEYVGYQQAHYSSSPEEADGDNYSFDDENQGIRRAYKGTVNVRVGAEGRFNIFRLRAGFATYGDPYQKATSSSRAQQFYTVGAGIRQRNFFLDLAGVYTSFNQQYSPYTIVSGKQPVINVNHNRYTTTVTAGLTF